MTACAAGATAQPLMDFSTLGDRVQPGARVVVRTTDGKALKGQLEAVAGTTIDLRGRGGVRQVPAATISAITASVPDPIRNGFIIGAATGAVGGALSAANFSGEYRSEDLVSGGIPFALFGAGLYGGIGALLDWRIRGSETVYEAAPPRVSVWPAVTARSVGLAGAMRW